MMRHFGAQLIYISHGAGYITHCISSVSLQHLECRLSHCRPVHWLSWYTKGRSVLPEDWRLFAVLRGTYPADVLVLGRLLVMPHTLRGKPALVQRTYLVLQNSPTKNLQQELELLFPWVRSAISIPIRHHHRSIWERDRSTAHLQQGDVHKCHRCGVNFKPLCFNEPAHNWVEVQSSVRLLHSPPGNRHP